MSELMFTVKSLLMAVILVACMQIRIGGRSIESALESSLKTSQTALWFQSAAAGGALALRNLFRAAEEKISSQMSSNENETPDFRASR